MPIVPLRPLLEATHRYGFAHGAFNVNTAAQAQAVIEIHDTFRSAAILQGADLANAFMGGRADFANGTVADKQLGARRIMDAVRAASQDVSIPVVMHLDHGHDMESIQAVNKGLIAFPGNVLLASHDHEMLQSVANRIIEFLPDGTIVDKLSTYDEYLEWKVSNYTT